MEKLYSDFTKWLDEYRRLSSVDSSPEYLCSGVFSRLLEEADIDKFTGEELRIYEDKLKTYRDLKNSLDSAKEIGFAKGRAEGFAKGFAKGFAEGRAEVCAEVVRKLLSKGMPTDEMEKLTGLSSDEIKRIL